jgi:hypothetical protein
MPAPAVYTISHTIVRQKKLTTLILVQGIFKALDAATHPDHTFPQTEEHLKGFFGSSFCTICS